MPFEGIAWAQTAVSQNTQQVLLTTVAPLAALFAIFYFLLIRPQTKKASDHQKVLSALKRNDEVVTTGGLLGKVVDLGDRVVTLELAQNVRVRVERNQIAGLSPHGRAPK